MEFNSCQEAVKSMEDEVRRDGFVYDTTSVSGLSTKKKCYELLGYKGVLSSWEDRDLVKEKLGDKNYEFLLQEFKEWIHGAENPGKAWRRDPETWAPFLTDDMRFTYTYPERFHNLEGLGTNQINIAINSLNKNRRTRQAFIGVWNPKEDSPHILREGAEGRVPCTIGYHLLVRPVDGVDRLFMIYTMRSLCVSWNLWNDLWLVTHLYDHIYSHVSRLLGKDGDSVQPGPIILQAGSLHLFEEVS